MSEKHQYTNHLIGATSPYLLQHAHNPVNWYPWSPEALEKARQEDKPILLSIGYSACHWCHVMAHESFEDSETAKVMDKLFVNIKVDREERPDLDKIYQMAHQLLTRRAGGWPLTLFLSPEDHSPFFAGTYFPREARHGLPSFTDVMHRVAAFYREHRHEIKQQNRSLLTVLKQLEQYGHETSGDLDRAPLDLAVQELKQSFDTRYGGFGPAPKFPHPTSIQRLLRNWAASLHTAYPDETALHMAMFTLRRMALGGIYDHLGGGFARYSVDEQWMIPHFEKMLYDNGPLLAVYADAAHAVGDPLFLRVVEETAAWVMREMQSVEGGYFSSLDADSEGKEGMFYVWDRAQVRALLNDAEYQLFAQRFGFDREPNFEGHWHLHAYEDTQALAKARGLSLEQVEQLLNSARRKLFAVREHRLRPGRDEKILTSWNGLMIQGMAHAGRVLGRPELRASAQRALQFIREHLWQNGRLYATYKDGRAHLAAYLDDYAFLIEGILELLQARWESADLAFALELAEVLLNHFEDRERGGFFFTADDHETLIHRPKPLMDDATPSGNGIAAHVLGRLGHLLGETRYLKAAERTLKAAWPALQQSPHAYNTLLLALEEYLYPPQILILRGKPKAMAAWQRRSNERYAPHRITLAIPSEADNLPASLEARRAKEGGVLMSVQGVSALNPSRRFLHWKRYSR
jgi:Highly conserved protein containing a thioredoxin domain